MTLSPNERQIKPCVIRMEISKVVFYRLIISEFNKEVERISK